MEHPKGKQWIEKLSFIIVRVYANVFPQLVASQAHGAFEDIRKKGVIVEHKGDVTAFYEYSQVWKVEQILEGDWTDEQKRILSDRH